MSSKYLQVYALKVMKKVGENVPSFYCEERDIMARTTSPWHTKLDYAFQVRLFKINLMSCDFVCFRTRHICISPWSSTVEVICSPFWIATTIGIIVSLFFLLKTSLMHIAHSLDETSVRFYTAEVALGIHDLHKMGFVHRDIKPENILIGMCRQI